MKKLLFILFLFPVFVFGQYDSLSEIVKQPLKIDTATVYSETGIVDFNFRAGNFLAAGSAFLFVGAVIQIANPLRNFTYPHEDPKLQSHIRENAEAFEKFNKTTKSLNIVSWSAIGISSVLCITSGILYAKQVKLRKNVKIYASPTIATIQLNF